MSASVNTIKRLLWVLLGVFALAYIISLNIENHFVDVNTKWLSNDFLFAIVGGAFASLVIVLVCEYIRYRQLKFATETALFSNLGNLYGQFLIIRSNCKRALNSYTLVADNLIQPSCNNAMMFADYINGTDYTAFCDKSKIKDLLVRYKTGKYQIMKSVLFGFVNLQIAIHTDKIELLKQKNNSGVTSDSPNVNKTLKKVIEQTTTILTYLDQIISQIDNELGNRYHWQDVKQTLNTYQENFVEQHLDDYLKEDVVVF